MTKSQAWSEARGTRYKSVKPNPIEAGKTISNKFNTLKRMDAAEQFIPRQQHTQRTVEIPELNVSGVAHVLGENLLRKGNESIVTVTFNPTFSSVVNRKLVQLSCGIFDSDSLVRDATQNCDVSLCTFIANVINQVIYRAVSSAISLFSSNADVQKEYSEYVPGDEYYKLMTTLNLISLASYASRVENRELNNWWNYYGTQFRGNVDAVGYYSSTAVSHMVAYVISHGHGFIDGIKQRLNREFHITVNRGNIAYGAVLSSGDIEYLIDCIVKMISADPFAELKEGTPKYKVPYMPDIIEKEDTVQRKKPYQNYIDLAFDDEKIPIGLNRVAEHMPKYKPIAFYRGY